ncbi:MAG: hypothetical protein KF832_16235 [Caldilineaceae bacterium]|nr:hypothetical protein [Caldilineaceae bacterium]
MSSTGESRPRRAFQTKLYELVAAVIAAANQLVQYVLAEYDTAKVLALVVTLPHHEQWGTVAPALFGRSADELEAAWQRYLPQHAHLAQ